MNRSSACVPTTESATCCFSLPSSLPTASGSPRYSCWAPHYAWSRFLVFDGVAVAVINTAAVLSGWMFGRGVNRYLDWFENTGTIVSSLAVVLLAFIALRWLVNRYMLRKR